MKKTGIAVMAMVAGAVLIPAFAQASSCCGGHAPAKKEVVEKKADEEAKTVTQTTCPIMGGKINKKQFVDHDGKRIYVCCPGCIDKIKKEPAKYIKKLEDEGVTLAKVQTKCPVMGGDINKKQYVDHDGERIYVCCPGCIGKIKADPEKYAKKLKDEGIALDPVPEHKDAKKEKHSGQEHPGHHH